MIPEDPEQEQARASKGAVAISHRRTHPITPLVTGWKTVVGIFAVVTAQNLARLLDDFTWQRALIAVGVVAAAVLAMVVLSALSWWFTTYAVDDSGVSLHKGLLSKSREFAPREKIESVTVERPLLARLLGVSKVRVEVAGGSDSYLDIEYIRHRDAEQLRRSILDVAAGPTSTDHPADAAEAAPSTLPGAQLHSDAPHRTDGPVGVGTEDPADARQRRDAHDPVRHLLKGEVTEGELIAEIPTRRLLHSLVRDADFLLALVLGAVGVVVAVGIGIWEGGFSFAALMALAPTVFALPKYVFGRIESGWGFVSRITERGLRMRRGLLNTRTDSIAAGRIQQFDLKRPLLWRRPGWTAVTVHVAGIEDESGEATSALPVGTREELRLTIGHLTAPLGTDDDIATIEHLLTARARDIDGWRAPHRLQWYARRTEAVVLLPGALVHRHGWLAKKLTIVPRDRIQQVELGDGPLTRRLGTIDLTVSVAGHEELIDCLPRETARRLHAVLAHDAATSRRYSERSTWRRPALAAVGAGDPAGASAREDR